MNGVRQVCHSSTLRAVDLGHFAKVLLESSIGPGQAGQGEKGKEGEEEGGRAEENRIRLLRPGTVRVGEDPLMEGLLPLTSPLLVVPHPFLLLEIYASDVPCEREQS